MHHRYDKSTGGTTTPTTCSRGADDARVDRFQRHPERALASQGSLARYRGVDADRTLRLSRQLAHEWGTLIEKKPGWLHVEGHAEFHFNGWIPETSVVPPDEEPVPSGIVGLLSGPKEVTHQVLVPIPLRLEPSNVAPVIGMAAKDAEILITPGPPGYRVIQFGVGVSAPQDASFFAHEADLRGAVRLADGVELGAKE